MNKMDEQARKPWEQQPDEPDFWFTRFEMYKRLGPERTLRLLAGTLNGIDGKNRTLGGSLSLSSRKYGWQRRAQAWDKAEMLRLSAEDGDRRERARDRRLEIIEKLMHSVSKVLVTADIGAMSRIEARAWLPVLRLYLKDLLAAERAELGLGTGGGDPESALGEFRADDFLQASRELAEWSRAQAGGNAVNEKSDETSDETSDAAADAAAEKALRREMYGMLNEFYTEQ
jgi:hypothetical protein